MGGVGNKYVMEIAGLKRKEIAIRVNSVDREDGDSSTAVVDGSDELEAGEERFRRHGNAVYLLMEILKDLTLTYFPGAF